jgi:hypothetical protein
MKMRVAARANGSPPRCRWNTGDASRQNESDERSSFCFGSCPQLPATTDGDYNGRISCRRGVRQPKSDCTDWRWRRFADIHRCVFPMVIKQSARHVTLINSDSSKGYC